MNIHITRLLIFIAILVALNFLFSEMNYGIHISIVGSLVITLVISLLMSTMGGRRNR